MFGLLSRLAGQLRGSGFIESILGNYFAASPKRLGILLLSHPSHKWVPRQQ